MYVNWSRNKSHTKYACFNYYYVYSHSRVLWYSHYKQLVMYFQKLFHLQQYGGSIWGLIYHLGTLDENGPSAKTICFALNRVADTFNVCIYSWYIPYSSGNFSLKLRIFIGDVSVVEGISALKRALVYWSRAASQGMFYEVNVTLLIIITMYVFMGISVSLDKVGWTFVLHLFILLSFS